jgi:hypothetical protein
VANGRATVDPAGNPDTGNVLDATDLLRVGILIRAQKGLFLVRAGNDTAAIEATGETDTGRILLTHDFPEAGALIWAEKGLFLASDRRC